MKKKIILQLLFFLFSAIAAAQSVFPGGVVGADVWYMVNYTEIDIPSFPNKANSVPDEIVIKSCNPNFGMKSLFNFNHAVSSVNSGKLCLSYDVPLEINTARNMFFVAEPKDNVINYANVATSWRTGVADLNLYPPDSLHIPNHFDLAAKNAYFNKRLVTYTATDNAYINFYHWNMYQTEWKLKSYGLIGETTFHIGRSYTTPTPPGVTANDFSGNFPEYISFPFELNANQKNRVESYLALKYGITLSKATSYRSSKNIVFWNFLNSGKFGERIFGIGRDNISGLNQLQSESVKAKNYLVASVGQLETTNPIKQGNTVIPNENFIVFGDNSGVVNALDPVNVMNVRTLPRKWLSQSTNVSTSIPMYFKLSTVGGIKQALAANPALKLWMLHDKSVNNTQVSNFTSQYVEYYETAGPIANDFGNFADVIFDPDKGTYDQFTFGVGPKMIVQVRFDPICVSTNIKSRVVITGGTAPYNIKINSTVYNQNFQTSNTTQLFIAPSSATYTVEVTDSGGNIQVVTIDISSPQIDVDLGPDKILNATTQQVTLNAYQANDLTATYKWYRNGVPLEEYQSTLVVTEPGTYKVEVTSGNGACQKSDTMLVRYNFISTVTQVMDCSKPYGIIKLVLSGGIAPYTTVISGPGQTTYQVHNSANLNFPNIGFGSYTVTTTDSNGQVVQKSIVMKHPLDGIQLDLLSQLQQNCMPHGYDSFICYDVVLNAGALVTNPNVTYEWFMDGNSMNIFTPTVVTYQDWNAFPNNNGYEFQVKIKNLDTGCIATETFKLMRQIGIKSTTAPMASQQSIATTEENTNTIQEEEHISISSKVYPNPSESGATFYYEVFSEESFDGVIEIYSPTGALIHQETISGESAYTIPFSLSTSGVYFIYTKTNGILLTDKIIIN